MLHPLSRYGIVIFHGPRESPLQFLGHLGLVEAFISGLLREPVVEHLLSYHLIQDLRLLDILSVVGLEQSLPDGPLHLLPLGGVLLPGRCILLLFRVSLGLLEHLKLLLDFQVLLAEFLRVLR